MHVCLSLCFMIGEFNDLGRKDTFFPAAQFFWRFFGWFFFFCVPWEFTKSVPTPPHTCTLLRIITVLFPLRTMGNALMFIFRLEGWQHFSTSISRRYPLWDLGGNVILWHPSKAFHPREKQKWNALLNADAEQRWFDTSPQKTERR